MMENYTKLKFLKRNTLSDAIEKKIKTHKASVLTFFSFPTLYMLSKAFLTFTVDVITLLII